VLQVFAASRTRNGILSAFGALQPPATKPIFRNYPAVATFTYLALRGIGTGHDLLPFHFKRILNRESLDLLPVLEIFRV